MDDELRKRLFEEIIACTTDAILTFDSDKLVVLFNPAAEKMFQIKAEEAVGQSLARFIPRHLRGTQAEVHTESGDTGNRRGFGVVTALRASGEEFPAEASVCRVAAGGKIFYTAIVRDISEGKRGEAALRETGQRLGLAVETAQLGTYERDLRTNEIRINDSCREILGVGEGVPPLDMARRSAHPEDRERVLATVARAFDPAIREVCAAEFRILRPDRSIRWVEGRGRVIFDESVKPARPLKFLGVLLDITERKLVETELTRAKQELLAINTQLEQRVHERTMKLREMMGELEHMSYSMIHDMRAPLRAVQNFAAILERDPKVRLSRDALHLLTKMQTAADRMDQLLMGALNYNEAVRKTLPVAPANVQKVLQDLLAVHPDFRLPLAEVVLDGKFPYIPANEAALAQCFAELLRNAIKFVEPGKLPHVRVWAECVRAPEIPSSSQPQRKDTVLRLQTTSMPHNSDYWMRLWFEDNGIGIPNVSRSKIFDLFERMHGPEYPGTGVGLALVRKLVEHMGGSVGVKSEVGAGSSFWLELPCPFSERECKRQLAA
jgi:PAS domain S-box-containing protein